MRRDRLYTNACKRLASTYRESEDIYMSDPTRRDSSHTEAREEDKHREAMTDVQVTPELARIGGERLEGSGFEEEEPEKEFL
jgi:hypothetical protein